MVWVWTLILGASLVNVVGFARAGGVVFWKAESIEHTAEFEQPDRPAGLSYCAVGGLIALIVFYTVFAGQAQAYMTSMSEQLFSPDAYITTVIETPGKLSSPKEGY